jgi:zinc protease
MIRRKLFSHSLFFIAALLMSTSCSHKPKKGEVAGSDHFHLKKYDEVKLANGLTILFVEDSTLPRVGFSLMIKSGAALDPIGQEGLMSLTMKLLESGTSHRDALKLADDFAQLGSSLEISTGDDSSMIGASTLAQYRQELLSLLTDVVMNPAFSQKELDRKKLQTIANLAKLVDNPSFYADLLMDKQIYGDHPYARYSLGNAKSVRGMSRTKIIRNYFEKVRPNNAILAVYGQIDSDFKASVKQAFGQWQKGTQQLKKMAEPTELGPKDLQLISHSGLQQAQIRFGELGIARNDPDFLKLRLANLILGGAFVSRLNSRVRDDLGLTYSISSQFDAKKDRGTFEISTFTRNDKVGETIKNTEEIFKQFVTQGITDSELASAKAVLTGQFPMAIETTDRLAYNLMLLRFYGVSDSYLKNFFDDVNAITVEQVNAAIHKHLSVENLKAVVYADQYKVGRQLKELGAFQAQRAQ